jgi:redox-sensing transcriptional repressor
MSDPTSAPEATVLRLSRYHCFMGELLTSAGTERVRSRQIAEQLGVSEETVRRDLSYIDMEGRPGAGYDPAALYEALEAFLGLSAHYPFVAIGSREMLESLAVIFPAEVFGLRPIAYYSALADDVGATVRGLEVRHLSEIALLDPCHGATVALVACAPESVPETLELLDGAGIHAVLMLTPMLRPKHPEGMDVTYFRIPCALKSLASKVRRPETCCGGAGEAAACGCSNAGGGSE